MFEIDNWTEIFNSIKQNKLRTFLTGFSISWGIFMFVFLLASSNSVQLGLAAAFAKRSINILELQGRTTSMSFEGFTDNRKINLDNRNSNLLNTKFPETEFVSPKIDINATISSKNNHSVAKCFGIYPNFMVINGLKISENRGRLFNELDLRDRRKVVIINERLLEIIFMNEDPIGKNLRINDIDFEVIGIFVENSFVPTERAYIPFTTAQLLYNDGWGFTSLAFTVDGLKTSKENKSFMDRVYGDLAKLHKFNPLDKVAMNIASQLKVYLQTVGIFNAVVVFIWIIGFGTLFAGMVGISNIMLITVRERTKEFGIRKAIGATPSSIIQGIIMESVCITAIFGYFGLFLGILVSKLFGIFINRNPEIEAFEIFKDPSLDIRIAIMAMIILIIVGVLAGYFPARQAVKIVPVEAMRDE